MPADEPQHDFLHYLTCDLPLGYPLKTPISKLLSPPQQSASRRELLHQQSRFLDFASQFLPTHPWIAYLAAIKHEAVLVAIPTYASQLVDIVDITFFHDLQRKNRDLRDASRAAMDEATASTCDRIILLQCEAAQIEDAQKYITGAIQAGYTAVEPLPPPPPEPLPAHRLLPNFIVIGAACLAVSAMIPLVYGGVAWGLAGAAATWYFGAQVFKKEEARFEAEMVRYKASLVFENYHELCRRSVAPILALPLETRKSALGNLPPCLAALEALQPEREDLEARFIRPFVPH